jgi:tetratricopeptide (TPR) repeat protein
MPYSKPLKYLAKFLMVISLILILSLISLAQQRRLGLDETSTKDKIDKEKNPKTTQENSSPRRYLPIETNSNRRFGLPGESEPETSASPVVLERPKPLVKQASQLATKGQLNQAVVIYQKAIEKKESLATAYFGLGYTLMRLGKLDEAINSFNESIKVNPNNPKAYLNLGVALHSLNKLDEAISQYKQAIDASKGNFPDAEFNLALALFHKEDFSAAIEHYKIATELRKIYPAAYNNLGLAYEALGNFELAAKNFQIAIKQNQKSYPLAHYNLGRFYFNQGKFFPEAVSQLELALFKQKNFPEVLLMLGNIHLLYEIKGAGKDTILKAKTFYEKAIELNPNYSLAYENLAIAYSRLGEKEEAFKNYRKAINITNSYSHFLIENLIGAITNNNSFFINDEFSRAEAPVRFTLNTKQIENNKEAIINLLKHYENLEDSEKALSDIHYCFAKIFFFIGAKDKAINELTQALELSNEKDTQAKELLNVMINP